MWVKIMSIVVGAFETVSKDLEKGLWDLEISGRIDIGQYTQKIPGDLKSKKIPTNTGAKNSQGLI